MSPRSFVPAAFVSLVCSLLTPGCHRSKETQEPFTFVPATSTLTEFHGDLREHQPYYHQGVFVTENGPNTALVVVTEPPPDVSFDAMNIALGAIRGESFVHPIGADGWARDVGFVVEHEGDADLADRLARLGLVMHGTVYGFAPRSAAEPSPSEELSIDLGVPTLAALVESERFDVDGRSLSAPQLLVASPPGLALGHDTAAFVVPSEADLCDLGVELRKFAVETDLVLGGILDDNASVIIARRRRVSPEVLPPLRVETLLRLSAQHDAGGEVGQSFERSAFAAGRVPFEGEAVDWAPIYLSNNAIDTDFGGLLNITDQMLKSWSLGGIIHYQNFEQQLPGQGPFGGEKLEDLLGTPEIVFNWNTNGASMLVAGAQGYALLATSRAGALPMQYNPDDNDPVALELEARAHDYFASLNEPQLARVVQYTAINQILQLTGTRASCVNPVRVDTEAVLVDAAELALLALRAGTYDLERGVSQFHAMLDEDSLKLIREALVQINQQFNEFSTEEQLALLVGVYAMQLTELLATLDDGELHELALLLADRNEVPWPSPKVLAIHEAIGADPIMRWVLHYSIDVPALVEAYEASTRESTNPWLKTARIVYSSNTEDIAAIGGHNISPMPRRMVIVDPSVRRGRLGYDPADPGLVRVHPNDIPKAQTIAKQLQLSEFRPGDKAGLERQLANAQPVEARPISVSPTPPQRATIIEHQTSASSGLARAPGWLPAQSQAQLPSSVSKALDGTLDSGRAGMFIEMKGASYEATIITRGGTPRTIKSGSTEGLLEVIQHQAHGQAKGIDVYFGDGMGPKNVSALHRTFELHQIGQASVRGEAVAKYAHSQIDGAPTLTQVSARQTLGAHETLMKVQLRADGRNCVLEVNVRSRRPLVDVKQVYNRLIPRDTKGKTMDNLIDELEAQAAHEQLSVDFDVIVDMTIVDLGDGNHANI
jgi:hypothetical protein